MLKSVKFDGIEWYPAAKETLWKRLTALGYCVRIESVAGLPRGSTWTCDILPMGNWAKLERDPSQVFHAAGASPWDCFSKAVDEMNRRNDARRQY